MLTHFDSHTSHHGADNLPTLNEGQRRMSLTLDEATTVEVPDARKGHGNRWGFEKETTKNDSGSALVVNALGAPLQLFVGQGETWDLEHGAKMEVHAVSGGVPCCSRELFARSW